MYNRVERTNMQKIPFQLYVANFWGVDPCKPFNFMNKYSMDEYGIFSYVLYGINPTQREISNSNINHYLIIFFTNSTGHTNFVPLVSMLAVDIVF